MSIALKEQGFNTTDAFLSGCRVLCPYPSVSLRLYQICAPEVLSRLTPVGKAEGTGQIIKKLRIRERQSLGDQAYRSLSPIIVRNQTEG
ncbi:MAG: hypothetical protein HC780_16835 [Leptolyngbyaceae cyanobacterium CSU_1_3]|nr:hypothetical protein [Leptolyngbyaceae cyanobacterium CSU_1_3]